MILLKNDVVETFTLLFATPGSPGDAVTVKSSDPRRLNAAVGADSSGRPAVVLNALVPEATGLTVGVFIADQEDAVLTIEVEIVADRPLLLTQNQPVDVDTVNTSTVPQARPADRHPAPVPLNAADRDRLTALRARTAPPLTPAEMAERDELAARDPARATPRVKTAENPAA